MNATEQTAMRDRIGTTRPGSKVAFEMSDGWLLAWAPDNYGSHPSKFIAMAEQMIEDVRLANPDMPPPGTEDMEVVTYGGPVRKRIMGIEWKIYGYKAPEGWDTSSSFPTDFWCQI